MRRTQVELMSSGAFARASGLSRKALRLYDELGLLPPARVDAQSGYRFYEPAQLEQARLVAWLRRLGMPLVTIRRVSTLPSAEAAAELAVYWERAEADIAARRELASFLIGYLSGKDSGMPDSQQTLTVKYAVRSDIGLIREDNEDAAYAGTRLLAVADGMGGHAAGEVASAAVIEALRPLDTAVPAGELLNALEHAVRRAEGSLRDMVAADPSLRGMGTTVTALLWSGSQLGLMHIGDTRVYLVRDGEVFQITHDHTVVQSLLDDGKITARRPRPIRSGCCCSGPLTASTASILISSCTRRWPETGTCSAPTACTRRWPPTGSPRCCSPWPIQSRPFMT
jgi:PPM family protein phosphatase